MENSHYNENGTDDNALDATAEDWLGDDGQGFVDYHVRQEKSDEQKVPIFADGNNLLSILLLLPAKRLISVQHDASLWGTRELETYSVPLMLRT